MGTTRSATFGEMLQRHRVAAGLTQEQLAERSGVSVRAISDLERGAKTRPQRATVRLLAEGLGLDDEERAALAASTPSRHHALDPARPGQNPPASPGPPRTNLLPEPTAFIGRRLEVASLTSLLDRPQLRLVTLTGPGGSGKTRLALEVAGARLGAYPDGVFWVSLAPLGDPTLVAPSVAAILGVTDTGEQAPIERLKWALRDKHLLLMLDNFEHLLEAAPVVGDLVRSCPSLHVLVTSRAVLHLAAEHEFPVPPLALPALTLVPDLHAVSRSDSVALFVDRAQAARPDFSLTHENAPYVAAICHRLDGLPLAIELAAARIRVLPPQELLGRLSRRFEILTGGARDRPTRQQTLRAAIDWSCDLLTPEEQALFARFSVFAGGWTLEAAEAVCTVDGHGAGTVLDGLASLVEQSLVRQEGTSESRFDMLETIREYAGRLLEERAEVREFRHRHALYFLALAQGIRPQLDGPGLAEGVRRLEVDFNNLRSALDWALESGDVETGCRLAVALESFADYGYLAEVESWFDTLFAAERRYGSRLTPTLRTEALQLGALNAVAEGNREKARALAEESIPLIGELSDRQEVAYRLHGAGFLLRELGDFGRAAGLFSEARALFTDLGDRAGLGLALLDLGDIAREEGDAHRLRELSEASAFMCHEVGNAQYEAFALHNCAVAARMVGELDRGRVLCEEALLIYGQTGMVKGRAEMLGTLAAILREQVDLDAAGALLTEALELGRKGKSEVTIIASNLEGMAGVAVDRSGSEYAVILFAAACALRERIGIPAWSVNRSNVQRDLALAKDTLGPDQFDTTWEQGRVMPVDEALEYALDSRLFPTLAAR